MDPLITFLLSLMALDTTLLRMLRHMVRTLMFLKGVK